MKSGLEKKVNEGTLPRKKRTLEIIKQATKSAIYGIGGGLDLPGSFVSSYLKSRKRTKGVDTIGEACLHEVFVDLDEKMIELENEYGKLNYDDKSHLFFDGSVLPYTMSAATTATAIVLSGALPIWIAAGMIDAAYGAYKNGKKELQESKKKYNSAGI